MRGGGEGEFAKEMGDGLLSKLGKASDCVFSGMRK